MTSAEPTRASLQPALGFAVALLWLAGLLVLSLWQTRSPLFHAAWLADGKALGQAWLSLPGFLLHRAPGALWIIPLALAAFGLGQTLLGRCLKLHLPAGPVLALGLGALMLLSFFLASRGWATPTIIRALLLALGAIGSFEAALRFPRPLRNFLPRSPASWAAGLAAAVAGLVVVMTLCQPTFGYDAITYHLALPRSYLQSGDTAPRPFILYSYFPENLEMLYLLGLAAGGVVSAQLVNALVWVTIVWLGRDLGRSLLGAEAGAFAALALALTPTLSQGAMVMVSDGGVALFGLLGLWFLVRLAERPTPADWWLWGAALGLAAGTKYTAYLFVILPQVAALLLYRRSWRGLGSAGLVALAVALPWWLRNFLSAGNPLFPALAGSFGLPLDPLAVRRLHEDAHAVALSWQLLPDLLRLPGRLFSLAPSQLDLSLGTASLLGPLAVAGLPFALPSRLRSRSLGLVWVYLALALGLWFGSFRLVRFVQPGLAAAAALSGLGLFQLRQRAGRSMQFVINAVLLGFALSGLGLVLDYGLELTKGFYYLRQPVAASDYLTLRSRDRTVELGSFPVLHALNQSLPADARVLFVGETASLYLLRPSLAPSFLSPNPLVHLIQEGLPFPAIALRLREAGLTHVLYRPDELDRLERSYGVNRLSPQDRARLDQFFSAGVCRQIKAQEQPRVIVCELVNE